MRVGGVLWCQTIITHSFHGIFDHFLFLVEIFWKINFGYKNLTFRVYGVGGGVHMFGPFVPNKTIFRASLTCQHWWDVQDWRESCARVLRGPAHIAHWLPIENYDNGWALTNSSLMSNIRSNNSVRLQKIWSIQSLKKLIIFQEQLFSTGWFFL